MQNTSTLPLPLVGHAAAPEHQSPENREFGFPAARETPAAVTAGGPAQRQRRPNERLVRIKEVIHRVGVNRATIYKWMKEGRFPRQVSLGANSAAWYESDLDAWIADPGAWPPEG